MVIKATFSIEAETLETVRAIAAATGQTIKTVISEAIADLAAKHSPDDLLAYRRDYEKVKYQPRRF